MAPLPTLNDTSLDDIWKAQSFIGYLSLNAAVVFALILWDYVQLLPEERSLYEERRRHEWRSPAPWAFIILRYSSLCSAIATVAYTSIRKLDCQISASTGQGAAAVVMAASGTILCCRVAAFWDYGKLPLAIVFVPCILMIIGWITVSTQFRAFPVILLPFGSPCQFQRLQPWSVVSYALTAAFNCIIFCMTIARAATRGTIVSENTGFTLVNRACLLYLLCATGGSIAVACVYSINWHDGELIRRVSSLYPILIMTTMGSRVFLNLQLHHQTLIRVAESNHFISKWLPPVEKETPARSDRNVGHESSIMTLHSTDNLRQHSLDTFTDTTRRTGLTVTDTGTPVTVASFGDSSGYSYGSETSYDKVMMSNPPPTRVRTKGGSTRSVASSSTRRAEYHHHYVSPRSPRTRGGTDCGQAGGSGGSVKSYATSSTSSRQKRIRKDSFKSITSETTRHISTLPPSEHLKSTWHGV